MAKPTKSSVGRPFFQFIATRHMPSPRCSFRVNSALALVPVTSKLVEDDVDGFGAGFFGEDFFVDLAGTLVFLAATLVFVFFFFFFAALRVAFFAVFFSLVFFAVAMVP